MKAEILAGCFFAIDFILKDKKLKKLDVTVTSSTKTAVCAAIAAGRVCEDKEKLQNGENASPTGAMSMVFKPGHTVFGGHGEVYERFCETGIISGYPGEGEQVAESSDANYNEASLRLMLFHETIKNTHKDVNYSMFLCKECLFLV